MKTSSFRCGMACGAMLFIAGLFPAAAAGQAPPSTPRHDAVPKASALAGEQDSRQKAQQEEKTTPYDNMQDMQAMCEKHRHMMASNTPRDQAMMEERLKSMAEEKKREHLKMMNERCR